jgi:hypothetical protein
MKKFPQFLKAMPEFLGLTLYDLPLIVIALYLALLLKLSGLSAIIMGLIFIVLRKLFCSKIDLVGFLCPKKKSIRLKAKDQYRGYDDTNI